jgi:hypothetical protein
MRPVLVTVRRTFPVTRQGVGEHVHFLAGPPDDGNTPAMSTVAAQAWKASAGLKNTKDNTAKSLI